MLHVKHNGIYLWEIFGLLCLLGRIVEIRVTNSNTATYEI